MWKQLVNTVFPIALNEKESTTLPSAASNSLELISSQILEKSSSNNNGINNSSNHNDDSIKEWIYVAVDVFKYCVGLGFTIYFSNKVLAQIKDMLNVMSQDNSQQTEAKKSLAKRLKRPDIVNMTFNAYEARLMTDVLGSDEIPVTFADIGGLEEEVEEVFDSIVFPIQLWHHHHRQQDSPRIRNDGDVDVEEMIVCPAGVLLYGAPGTGKTLIAKAIAKESGATFINIKASSVMDKWFGESDRLISALFSLARKLGPSIVFIDEIETLLRKRDGSLNNPALTTLQGVFLAEWDGLVPDRKESSSGNTSMLPPVSAKGSSRREEIETQQSLAPVVVLGATNRPSDIDPAFLRRMPVQIRTRMPNKDQRLSILLAMLRDEELTEDITLVEIAEQTEGYSGSDLRELVRIASLQRMKEIKQSFRQQFRNSTSTKKEGKGNGAVNAGSAIHLVLSDQSREGLKRPLTQEDFEFALEKTRQTVQNTMQFNQEVFLKDNQKHDSKRQADLKYYSDFLSILNSLSSETSTK